MRARRSAVVLLATGVTCLAGAVLPLVAATADSEPGSGLGSFSLAANSPVLQIRYDDPANQCSAAPAGTGACEGVLNESVATLRNGPVGHALASVGWPGTLGGNLGSLLIVASNGQVPDQASALNDPVKAENFTSAKADTVTNNQLPGTLMTATATAAKVVASSVIGAAQATPLGSFGHISSTSSTTLTGEKSAEAVAHSEVQDITLGPLHLGAVVSDAKATTDGTKAVSSGRTVVTGASVAGVPVTIDQHGITVQTQNLPFPTQAVDAVNAALAQSGMVVAVSTPIGKPDGADVIYNAGALNIVWKPSSGSAPSQLPKAGVATLVLGGAQVSVAASQGYSFDLGGIGTGTTGTSVPSGGAAAPVSGSAPLTGSSGVPGGLSTGTVPPPALGGAPLAPAASASPLRLPHGLSPWLVMLGVAGAALVMAGLRRLPDRVLVAPASSCPQGELA